MSLSGSAGATVVQPRVELVDPHDCTDDPDKLAILEAVHEALVRRGPDGRWRPALAERWSVSDDARTWTFELRQGVRFHDGSPVDAEAAAWSIRRMARPDMGATLGAPAVWAQYLGGCRVEVVSASTLRLALDRPMADLPDVLGSGYVLSPAAPDAAPVGCGPYRPSDLDPGHRLTLSAEAGAGPARLHLQAVTAAADRARALAAGSAQVAAGLDAGAAASLAGRPDATVAEYLVPTAIIYLFNMTRSAVADPRIRRALNLAVDRRALVSTLLGGGGRPLTGFMSPAHFGAPPDPGPVGPDPEEARRLLREAGAGGGLELTVTCPTSLPDEAEALTAALAEQVREIGIALRVERVEDRVAYANRVRLKQVGDLCVFDSSPMSTFRVLHEKIDSRNAGSWWQGYRNPAVEDLLDRARATVEGEAREAVYRECYRLLQQDPPWLYLYNHTRHVGLAGRHPGWRMRADGVLDLRGLPAL